MAKKQKMSNLTQIYHRVNPRDFDITPQVIAEVTDIPVSQIRRIVKKKYVILVHRWHMLSVFVSYRKVGEWLLKVELLIRRCATLEELVEWKDLLAREYKRFKYPREWVDTLNFAWQQRQWQIVLGI
ncbi:MAG: hypothetical protein MUC60_10485 [Oscillatoria sp. Prado101]|nr:hypothetical protein [Oscillatoria sp. Prado101]